MKIKVTLFHHLIKSSQMGIDEGNGSRSRRRHLNRRLRSEEHADRSSAFVSLAFDKMLSSCDGGRRAEYDHVSNPYVKPHAERSRLDVMKVWSRGLLDED